MTPTILALYGLPQGRDMDGKPLLGAFESPPNVEYIQSWDAVPGEAGTHPPDVQLDPVDQAAALKQLVDLGYIERPDENRETAVAATVKELRCNLARDLFDARRILEAAKMFEALWNEYPDEGRFGSKLLECHLELGRAEEARAAYTRLVAEKERYATEAYNEMVRLDQEWKGRSPEDFSEDDKSRIRLLRRKASVNRPALAYFHGMVLAMEGDFERALQALNQAEGVQIHNRPSLYQCKAGVLIRMGRWGEAEQCYKSILKIDPINPLPHIGLARCHLALRRPGMALEEAIAALGMVFHNPQAHYLCGLALLRLGRKDEAIVSLQTAVAQNPVFPNAHRLLAEVYRSGEQFDKASEHRALAKAAQERIASYRAGNPLYEDVDLSLDLKLESTASVADLSTNAALPPLNDAIVIVSGLPRSGTSLAMQMLAAGGVPTLIDSARQPDENNPRGYYELEAVKRLGQGRDAAWLDEAQGKALKVVAPLLPELPVAGHSYRIIFMERPLKEIIASQAAMLKNLGRGEGWGSERSLAAAFLKQVDNVRAVLAAHSDKVSVLSVPYRQALEDPAAVASALNRFLGGGCDEAAMVAAVDPGLYRQRSEKAPGHE